MSQQQLAESNVTAKQQIARSQLNSVAARPPQDGFHSAILQLQRTLGNQRVAQLIQTRRITPEGKIIGLQPKLTVGAADDQYEQEADQVARQVVSMPDSVAMAPLQQSSLVQGEANHPQTLRSKPLPLAASITPFVQRHVGKDGWEPRPIQGNSTGSLAHSFEAGDDIESQVNQSKGGGSKLLDSVRAYMEPRFGVDFSHVRAHISSDAIQMNRDIGAQAFAHGADIYYGAGSGPANLELTAHELAHVVQQTGGAPLRMKKLDETCSTKTTPFLQRACAACAASDREKKGKDSISSSSVVQRQPQVLRRLTEGNIIGLQPEMLLQRSEDDNEKDRSRQSRPRNAPRGTKPIDQSDLDREDIHRIKPQVGAGPRDWVGITPDGEIITTDEEGNAENHGPVSDYLKEAHPEVPSWVWPILITVGIIVIAGVIACFATGVCEFAAVVGGLSFGSALIILALLKRAGIIDSGSGTTAAAEVQDEPSEGTG